MELQEAAIKLDFPGFERVPNAAKALAWRRLSQSVSSPSGITSVLDPPVSRQAQKEGLQSIIKKKVGRLVRVCQQQGIAIPGRNPHQAVNLAWGRHRKYSQESTNSDLEAKLDWLENLIQRALRSDFTLTSEFR